MGPCCKCTFFSQPFHKTVPNCHCLLKDHTNFKIYSRKCCRIFNVCLTVSLKLSLAGFKITNKQIIWPTDNVIPRRRSPGRLLNVLCTFNLRPVSTGELLQVLLKFVKVFEYRDQFCFFCLLTKLTFSSPPLKRHQDGKISYCLKTVLIF